MQESHNFKALLTEMEQYIEDYIIDRGLAYYEQGLVKDVQIKEPWVHATVPGNYGNYKVKIHLTDFSKSQCNCPYDDYCKHMAAVVYYAVRTCAGQPDDGELAGVSRTGAAHVVGADDTGTIIQQSNQQPEKILLKRLKNMENDDLLATITRLIEIKPDIQETLRLILNERERTADLHSDRVSRMELYSSLAYHQKRFPAVLKECEFLFTEIDPADEDNYRYRYRYNDYDDTTMWDFTEGLEILNRYGQELLQMVTAEHFISGTVGLLVTMRALAEWIVKYSEEYDDNELEESCLEFEGYLSEALGRVRNYQINDTVAQTFLLELIDWIILQCNTIDDLPAWTPVLNYCIPELRYFLHLKERITGPDKNFLRSTHLHDEWVRQALASWWVDLCLSFDQEEEAKQTAGIVEGSSQFGSSIMYSFVRYYEKLERWPEAVIALKDIINNDARNNPNNYRWIVHLCEKSGDRQGMKEWYEKWFLFYPDLELFKQNTALIEDDANKEAKTQLWLEALEAKKEYRLLISIYLSQGDIDKAWFEFIRHKDRIQTDGPAASELFLAMKKHEPARLISVYSQLALNNISAKNRPAYARAAGWMKELKEVCGSSGNEKIWVDFHGRIMREYYRFHALMDEIRTAGIGQP